jgi:hypothetical protein
MPKRVSPLLALANKLLAGRILSLSSLTAQIGDAENFAKFVDIVKTYLPEREQEILHEPTPQSQMARFASYFEDRYFPLEEPFKWGDIEGYSEITYRIPLVVMGLSYDDYHEMPEYRPGAQLMTYLIDSPWGSEDTEDTNVSLAEACSEHVPDELVERAGRIRLSPGAAHSLLNGTKYEPLALWADRLHYNTGSFFLDTDYETLWNSMPPDWDPETVAELTRQWQQAELQNNTTGDFMEWLEKDLPGHFEELVSFIEGRKADEEETSG